MRRLIESLVLFLLIALPGVTKAQQKVGCFNLNELPGFLAVDINNRGHTLTRSLDNDGYHHYLNAGGRKIEIFDPRIKVWPVAINDSGAAVGYATDALEKRYGFLWQNGKTTIVEPPNGGTSMEFADISNTGKIVGQYVYEDSETAEIRPVTAVQIRGKLVARELNLSSPSGVPTRQMYKVTALGTWLGSSGYEQFFNLIRPHIGTFSPFGGTKGYYLQLPLPPTDSVYTETLGTDINARGEVVGNRTAYYENLTLRMEPILWRGLRPQVLPTLGGDRGVVNGINSSGVAVGWE